MTTLAWVRALHVLGVVLWIGGVAMVTTVLLPAVKQLLSGEERLLLFERIEGRFARQARWTTLLTGLSGFYMLYALQGWGRLAMAQYWWIDAMVLVWLIFTVMLFVLEPFVLHRLLRARATRHPAGTFALIQRMHWVLLILSLIALVSGVSGAHGGFL